MEKILKNTKTDKRVSNELVKKISVFYGYPIRMPPHLALASIIWTCKVNLIKSAFIGYKIKKYRRTQRYFLWTLDWFWKRHKNTELSAFSVIYTKALACFRDFHPKNWGGGDWGTTTVGIAQWGQNSFLVVSAKEPTLLQKSFPSPTCWNQTSWICHSGWT